MTTVGRLTRSQTNLPGGRSSGVLSASRWADRRTRSRGGGTRDDLRKLRKMKFDKFDDFDEWIDGDCTMRYSPHDTDARKHLSGWAMRNTNNHNKKVLKKSCLGVFLCSKSCRTLTGEITAVRPATSDKARQKQSGKACSNPQCEGRLYHVLCKGKTGYPATHFWRVTEHVILFQCKGIHDHPKPDVVKTTTAAKHALYEYHRRHRNERPKEICKKVGVYIHKSFSRVDRVARQLREVVSDSVDTSDDQSPSAEDHNPPVTESHPCNLRYPDPSSYHDYWTSPHKAVDAVKHAAVPSMSASYYHTHQPDMYSHLPLHHDSYASYGNPNPIGTHNTYSSTYHDYQSTSPSYNHSMGHHGYHHHRHQTESSFPTVSSNYLDIKPENGYGYQHLKHSPRQATIPTCSPNHEQPRHQPSKSTHYNTGYHAECQTSSSDGGSKSTFKRKGAPHLIPIEHSERKQIKLQKYEDSVEMNPIKLSDHTPGINLDLSNFADIFDFSGLVQQDEGLGLAGRPKTATLVANNTTSCTPPPAQSPERDQFSPTHVIQEKSLTKIEELQPCVGSPVSDTESSPESSTTLEQSDIRDATPQIKFKPSPTSTTNLTTLNSHHPNGPGHGDEESEGYINFLVKMYLGKDERQISTLKSEFTVYTSDLHKAYSNRNHAEMMSPHNLYKTPSGQYEFSWYNTEPHHCSYSDGPHSPYNVSARFEYPVNHHSEYASPRHHERSYYE